tara:strand:- start:211 stop:690 length:480 start_codon:yes stop_codon:yes gene_type:complete
MADTSPQGLIETARETARLTREYANDLNVRERRLAERKFLEIQNIILGGSPVPDQCPPSTYARAFDWARSKGWFTNDSTEFADLVMEQPQCERYLDTYILAFDWARSKGWFTNDSKQHAISIAPHGVRTHNCYVEAFDWARSQGWFTDRSKDHAQRLCL